MNYERMKILLAKNNKKSYKRNKKLNSFIIINEIYIIIIYLLI